MESEIEQLKQAISALEAQRPVLGDTAVEAALAPLREKLAKLMASRYKAAEMTGERKLVTVLFADISEFTSLAEDKDPEILSDLINRLL